MDTLHNHECYISQKMYGKGCSRYTLTVYFSLLAGHKVLLVIYYVALYLSINWLRVLQFALTSYNI
jgi:hypothetical protein